MNHIRILRRAWHITLDYRVLWVFGILLALTTGSRFNGSSNGGGSGSNAASTGSSVARGMGQIQAFIHQNLSIIIGGVIGLVCLAFILAIAFAFLRYISETALIRMVNDYEATGEKVSVRQGFRLGWSRGAWRIFLTNLLFGVSIFVIIILLLVVSATPLLLWLTKNNGLGALGTVIAIGMFLLVIFAAILVAIALSLLQQFFWRAAVLEDRGVFDAIRRGFGLVWRHLGDVIVMGLILFGLGILVALLMIPVVIILLLVGVVVGGLPALLAWTVTNLFAQGATPWIAAAVIGLPIFFLVIVLPMLFLSGLVKTYTSTAWTLAYREVVALDGTVMAPASPMPAPAPVSDESPARSGAETELTDMAHEQEVPVEQPTPSEENLPTQPSSNE